MAATAFPEVLPDVKHDQQTDSAAELDPGYLVICWDDPVNLMDYVTHVFQVVFGWERKKAEKHMLEVHQKGRSIVWTGMREPAESYVQQLHAYLLLATIEKTE